MNWNAKENNSLYVFETLGGEFRYDTDKSKELWLRFHNFRRGVRISIEFSFEFLKPSSFYKVVLSSSLTRIFNLTHRKLHSQKFTKNRKSEFCPLIKPRSKSGFHIRLRIVFIPQYLRYQSLLILSND